MRRFKYVLHGLVLGGLVALGINVALANRNSSGVYSLPNPAVVTGTTISSTWANSTLSDLGTEITNSLDRSGRGPMTGPLRLFHGASAGAPDLAWDVETTAGLYRFAAGDFRFSLASVDAFKFNSSGFYVLGTTPWLLGHDIVSSWAGQWGGTATTVPTVNNYSMLSNGATTLLNAATGGTVEARVNNVSVITVAGSSITAAQPLSTSSTLTIGSGGTAISKGLRGTLTLGAFSLGAAANSCGIYQVTVTGAVVGAECSPAINPNGVVLSPATFSGGTMHSTCLVTAANICSVGFCNTDPVNGGQDNVGTAGAVVSCRVWNP